MKTMNRGLIAVVAAVAGALGYMAYDVQAADAPKPEKGVVVGTAISIPDYAMEGRVGEEYAESATFQCEEGFPVGILEEETNKVWIAVWRDSAPASHLETANEKMKELMGKKITASGLLYSHGGINLIRMSLVSEY